MNVSPSLSPRDMRCADSDRQLVVDLLSSAYAEGRITLDEHDERTTTAWAARTFAELDALTTDLVPTGATTARTIGTAPRPTGAVVRTDGAVSDTDTIWSLLSTARREGSWRLRRRTQVNTVLGDCKIDLRTATLDAPECHIQVFCTLGDVKVWVPEGIAVELRVTPVLGDQKVKGMRATAPGSPRVVIEGLALLGDVTVYGPEHVGLGKRLGITA